MRTGQEEQYYVGFWNIYGHNPRDLEYRFQRTVPIHVSPHSPNRVYHASQYVHVTENGAALANHLAGPDRLHPRNPGGLRRSDHA